MPDADQADLELLETCVRSAGQIARRYFHGKFERWQKEKGGPVTEADLAIDSFLNDKLRSARPAYGWLSEESEDDTSRLKSDSAFIVDPIDGTLAFVRGKPHFTICACVARRGRAAAGVVYNPITEECFSARAGAGAHCNGRRIATSTQKDIPGCRMLGDKAMFEHPAWSKPPSQPWPEMHIESRSSIAYRMALVARGDFDAMTALSPKHDWDIAAAQIIVTEAGGICSTHQGDSFLFNQAETIKLSVLAAGPLLHAALLERVRHLKLPNSRT